MRSVKNCVEIIILLIVLGAALYTQRVAISEWVGEKMKPELPLAVEYEETTQPVIASSNDSKGEAISDSPVILSEPKASEGSEEGAQNDNETASPDAFNLAVPFTPQAPHADWSLPYKEACEEASLYMVHAYYQGVKTKQIDADTAKSAIDKIVEFEKGLFGFYEDTTTAQTATLAEMMYGYTNVETIDNPTVEQIKTHVAAGRPVIVPLSGRQLGNPYFTAPGPIYHMFVIRGYTKDGKFITNDPGTKHGEEYVYDFDTVMNAMHDWNGDGEMTDGKKIVLVVYPN